MKELLADFPVVVEIPVAWGEMDSLGHVNNIVYFRYFETSRIAYFERLGFLTSIEETGIGPILASISCKFKMPVTFPDTVAVGTRVSQVADDRFVMEYAAVSRKAQRVAAEGDSLIVSYDYRLKKKAALPPDIRRRIHELEQTAAR